MFCLFTPYLFVIWFMSYPAVCHRFHVEWFEYFTSYELCGQGWLKSFCVSMQSDRSTVHIWLPRLSIQKILMLPVIDTDQIHRLICTLRSGNPEGRISRDAAFFFSHFLSWLPLLNLTHANCQLLGAFSRSREKHFRGTSCMLLDRHNSADRVTCISFSQVNYYSGWLYLWQIFL